MGENHWNETMVERGVVALENIAAALARSVELQAASAETLSPAAMMGDVMSALSTQFGGIGQEVP